MFFSYQAQRPRLLVTVATGKNYLERWKTNALPSWTAYADAHNFGIMALSESLVADDAHAGWNKFKMLARLKTQISADTDLVIMDADQIISPLAPDLTGFFAEKKFGVVPEHYGRYQKLLSFLRQAHLDPQYPLDSYLLATPEMSYRETEFTELQSLQFYSAGLIIVPSSLRDSLEAFSDYGPEDKSARLDGGGDQIPFLKFLSRNSIHPLPAQWQGIWPQILAVRYPFLYVNPDRKLAAYALASSLAEFHCVHFSTTWPEKDFWDIDFRSAWSEIFESDLNRISLREYIESSVTPKIYGQIRRNGSFFPNVGN